MTPGGLNLWTARPRDRRPIQVAIIGQKKGSRRFRQKINACNVINILARLWPPINQGEIKMPGPDPDGIEPGDNWPRNVLSYHFGCGNNRHRIDRARRILQNARWGEWSCRHCGDPVPIWRRSDAIYCSTGCRKRAMRLRNGRLP